MNEDIIIGRNPVMEAIKSGREINKILIAENSTEGSIRKLIADAKNANIIVQTVDRQKLNQLAEGGTHQGVVAYVSPYAYTELEELVDELKAKGERMFFILCDEINDPHNLGSIIRTANASGATGVIIPKRRSVAINSTVVKSSAGAVEYVPVCRVTNMARTIDYLKENGVWIAAADMDGDRDYFEADFKGHIGLVIGGEGSGVGRLIKEKCDFVVKIPMIGKVNSLNASVAASILMYEVVRQSVGKKSPL